MRRRSVWPRWAEQNLRFLMSRGGVPPESPRRFFGLDRSFPLRRTEAGRSPDRRSGSDSPIHSRGTGVRKLKKQGADSCRPGHVASGPSRCRHRSEAPHRGPQALGQGIRLGRCASACFGPCLKLLFLDSGQTSAGSCIRAGTELPVSGNTYLNLPGWLPPRPGFD